MTLGVQRFLANNLNAIRTAVLAATSVKPHAAIFRTATVRDGNGRVTLTGNYSGDEDATFDVELAAGGGTPRVSAPTFAGVGSGTLSGLTVAGGTAAQTFTIRLANLGTDTDKAGLAIGPVVIQARTAGAGGNSIYLTVNETALVYTPADFALLDAWSAGTPYQEGEKWSWNSQPLLASGELAPGTKRYTIGDDIQIFRPYRKFETGKWRYYLTPTPERDLPKGARLKEVTGSRTVTVTSGATVETYPTIVTLYDLLAALTASALVEVTGVVANDAAPDGQAALDLPLKTAAYRLPVVNEGSSNVRGLDNVTISPDAATENVTIECVDAGQLGRERWGVLGDVSGELPQAITGLAYSADRFGFTIPERLPPEGSPAASFILKDYSYATRLDTEISPPICLDLMTLGASAQSKTITLTYKRRPPASDCACENVVYTGRVSEKCLGINIEGQTMPLDPQAQTRLEALYNWRADYIRGNTGLKLGVDNKAEMFASVEDITLVDSVARRFTDAVVKTFAVPAAMTEWDDAFSQAQTDLAILASSASGLSGAQAALSRNWGSGQFYRVGETAIPTTRNGHYYTSQSQNFNGVTEPTWPTNGTTVADGDVTWLDSGAYWTAGATIPAAGAVSPRDGYTYTSAAGGVTGATEPIWANGSIADGTVTWVRVLPGTYDLQLKEPVTTITAPGGAGGAGGAAVCGPLPIANTWIVRIVGTVYQLWVVTPSGAVRSTDYTTAAAAESARALEQLESDTYHAVALANYNACLAANPGTAPTAPQITTINNRVITVEQFVQRYYARMDIVLVLGGIVPNFDLASSQGSDCWQDVGDSHWWEVNGLEYLPAFTNVVYHSVKKRYDSTLRREVIDSTKEFAFVIKVKCPQHLKPGDTVTLEISDTGARGYQPGDKFTLPIVVAQNAYLAGGVTGNDTHTWRVTGTVAGALANYAVVDGAETPYSAGGLGFTIYRGGIPFELGDTWSFDVEAGQYRWRKNGGAWSGLADIPASPAALSDGLSAVFTPGAAPSFVAADSYSFRADQVNAPSHLSVPTEERWAWSGTGATLTADLGGTKTVDALAIARHTLPSGATVTVEGSADGGATWPLSQALTWRSGVMAALLVMPWSVNQMRLVVASATGGAIGYWHAGSALAVSSATEKAVLTNNYRMDRGDGGALYIGRGQGATLEYGTWLPQSDLDLLLEMIDALKLNNNEPLILIPHHLHPDEARLVRHVADNLDLNEDGHWQANVKTDRLSGMTLAFEGVIE